MKTGSYKRRSLRHPFASVAKAVEIAAHQAYAWFAKAPKKSTRALRMGAAAAGLAALGGAIAFLPFGGIIAEIAALTLFQGAVSILKGPAIAAAKKYKEIFKNEPLKLLKPASLLTLGGLTVFGAVLLVSPLGILQAATFIAQKITAPLARTFGKKAGQEFKRFEPAADGSAHGMSETELAAISTFDTMTAAERREAFRELKKKFPADFGAAMKHRRRKLPLLHKRKTAAEAAALQHSLQSR